MPALETQLPVIDKSTETEPAVYLSDAGPERLEDYPLNPATSDNHASLRSRLTRLASTARRIPGLLQSIRKARKGLVQLPRVLTHTLTFGCNAKCVFCDSWKLSTNGDLTLEEIKQVYRQLPAMDVVRLTGGEPFLRKDILEVQQAAIEHLQPMLMHISTNGFLTKRIVDFCRDREKTTPLEIAISIDGVDDFHDNVRGNSTAFRSAWKTLEQLVANRKQWNLSVVVNQTIASESGFEQYDLLHDRLDELGVEHHVIIAYDESATYSLERERRIEWKENSFSSFADLDKDQLAALLERADKHARELPTVRRRLRQYYLRGVRSRTLQSSATPNPTCQALHTHLRIFPNGDVPVCQFNSRAIGNFRKQSFTEIWASVEAEQERKWVRACTGCWAECEVATSAVYTLDIFGSK